MRHTKKCLAGDPCNCAIELAKTNIMLTLEEYIAEFNHYRNIMADLLSLIIYNTNFDQNKWADLGELLNDDIDGFKKEIKKILSKTKFSNKV